MVGPHFCDATSSLRTWVAVDGASGYLGNMIAARRAHAAQAGQLGLHLSGLVTRTTPAVGSVNAEQTEVVALAAVHASAAIR